MNKKLLCAAAAACLGLGSAQAAEMGAVDEPIKLAMNEWTGQHITTHVAGAALQKAGYKVEYVVAGYESQYPAISDGEIHGAMEIWTSNVPDLYGKLAETGGIEDIGSLGIDAREGFIYPVHVKEMCPGLPAWEALKDCADVFATAETIPEGRLIDYPADWGTPGADRLKGLQLPYKAVPAGSEGALISEIKASVAKKSPLLIVFWQPHWALSEFDVEWVDMPKAEPACFDDPSWGMNSNEVFDCDFPASRLFKIVWSGFKGKWPHAHQILQNMEIETAEQQAMMAEIDQQGKKLEDVVAAWVGSNSSTVDSWIASN